MEMKWSSVFSLVVALVALPILCSASGRAIPERAELAHRIARIAEDVKGSHEVPMLVSDLANKARDPRDPVGQVAAYLLIRALERKERVTALQGWVEEALVASSAGHRQQALSMAQDVANASNTLKKGGARADYTIRIQTVPMPKAAEPLLEVMRDPDPVAALQRLYSETAQQP